MSIDPQATPTTASERRMTLRGGWLVVARVVWVLVALVYVGVFVYSLPLYYVDMTSSPAGFFLTSWEPEEVQLSLKEIGLSASAYVGFIAIINILFVVVSGVVGVVIFWRRSDEVVGLLTAFALVGLGVAISESFQALPRLSPQLDPLVSVLFSGYFVGFMIFMLIFPDGRFVSAWTRAGAALLIIYMAVGIFSPAISLLEWNKGIGLPVTILMWGMAAYSQIYRFRNKTDVVLRQQIKWLALSLLSVFLNFTIVLSAFAFIPSLGQPGGMQIVLLMLAFVVSIILVLMIPISIGIAITRYRLWDIDIVINRSLVYALVTLTLGVVFLAGFAVIQALLEGLMGGEQGLYPAILSSALVAGLFSPTRRRLRQYVDRRFYGIDLDYTDAARQEEARAKSLAKKEPVSSFGKYKALGLIGRGGMGEVYKANDPKTGETVAIKTLYIRGEGNEEELIKRFNREAQAIEDLEHENIVRLFDYGEEDDLPYMVMEYVEGSTLSSLIRSTGGMPMNEALPLFEGIASALDYAHGKGIVHRDIKPSNVIVEEMGGMPPRAVLMDFGIARMISAMTALTGTGGMVGTLDYIAPEQIQGAHQVDARADIYSFGVMAYQMLTGELPFKHRNPGALIMAHLTAPPPDGREVVKDLPRNAAKAVQRAMAKEREDRFETAGAFLAAMRGNGKA